MAALAETGQPIYLMIADGKRFKGYLGLDPGFKLWRARTTAAVLGDMARTDFVLALPWYDVRHHRPHGAARRPDRHRHPPGAGAAHRRRAGRFIALDTMGAAVIQNARAYAPAAAAILSDPLSPPRHPPRPVLAPDEGQA